MITLAIDAMSGDRGLAATVPAAVDIVRRYAEVKLILVGDLRLIERQLATIGAPPRVQIEPATELVTMDESPAIALRKKKDSSMRVAINLVQTGRAAACISAGNTGALLAVARFVLKTIRGIDRPAICTALPRLNGQTYMLDLGANVGSSPEVLFQFGLMGATLIKCITANSNPSVGLLNIGTEDVKGNETIKTAAKLFKQSQLNYVGFVEADDIYRGDTDLIVCDGFAGNVALKAAEGVAQMISGIIKQQFNRTWLTRSAGLITKPVLNAIKTRLDHRRYNGASLLGLRGCVIKSHGGADAFGFGWAIEVALREAQNNVVQQIECALDKNTYG